MITIIVIHISFLSVIIIMVSIRTRIIVIATSLIIWKITISFIVWSIIVTVFLTSFFHTVLVSFIFIIYTSLYFMCIFLWTWNTGRTRTVGTTSMFWLSSFIFTAHIPPLFIPRRIVAASWDRSLLWPVLFSFDRRFHFCSKFFRVVHLCENLPKIDLALNNFQTTESIDRNNSHNYIINYVLINL